MAGIGQFPFALCPNAFGGLTHRTGGLAQVFNIAPSLVTVFNELFPDFSTTDVYPEGVEVSLSGSLLIPLQRGVYLAFIQMNGTIAAGSTFTFEVYVNGVASGVKMSENVSNQTTTFSGALSGAIVLTEDTPGIQLFGSADQDGRSFTPAFCDISLSRIR